MISTYSRAGALVDVRSRSRLAKLVDLTPFPVAQSRRQGMHSLFTQWGNRLLAGVVRTMGGFLLVQGNSSLKLMSASLQEGAFKDKDSSSVTSYQKINGHWKYFWRHCERMFGPAHTFHVAHRSMI